MTGSRKFVLTLAAAFLGIVGYMQVDDWRLQSRADAVCEELKVGDSREEIGRVMNRHGFEPYFSAKDRCFSATAALHHKRMITILVYVDDAGRVVRTELKRRTFL